MPAVLNRARDYYDTAWYLFRHKNLRPDFPMLSSGLAQSAGDRMPANMADQWHTVLAEKIERAGWKAVRQDAIPFLERPRIWKFLLRRMF